MVRGGCNDWRFSAAWDHSDPTTSPDCTKLPPRDKLCHLPDAANEWMFDYLHRTPDSTVSRRPGPRHTKPDSRADCCPCLQSRKRRCCFHLTQPRLDPAGLPEPMDQSQGSLASHISSVADSCRRQWTHR